MSSGASEEEVGLLAQTVPRNESFRARGKSEGPTMSYQDLELLNSTRYGHLDSTRVTIEEAIEHGKANAGDDKHLRYERPYYPLLFDWNQQAWRDRHYFLVSGVNSASLAPDGGSLLLV